MYHLTPPLPNPWVFDDSRDPPVYTRPLVGSEHAMQRHWNEFDADGEVCIGVNFTSSLRVEELKDRAREALDKLRFVCPVIACTVEDVVSPRWVYTPSANREAWLNLAFAVEERGPSINASEFLQSINLKRLPYTDRKGTTIYLRAYLLTTSKEREGDDDSNEYGLYFHGSHTIVDAGPALRALNLMCEWISGEGLDVKIEPSEEWKNLAVDPITATGGTSKEWSTAGIALLEEFAAETARTTPRHALPPPTRPLNMAHPLFRYILSVSESETAAVIAATKKLGVSVSALFHAAHCLALHKMNPAPEGAEADFPYETIVVNLERWMQPPVDPRTHFISSFTLMPSRFSMTPVLKERSERARLIKTAKILQERFDRYLANPCLSHMSVARTNMERIAFEGKTEAEEAPIQWFCIFNNLGEVEKKLKTHHGKINIENIGIGNRLRNYLTVHTWTIHSKLYFQVQGATAWGEECIKTMLEETRRIGLLVLDES